MSDDRIEVTLGPDVGKKTFKDFAQVRDWLNKEREFCNLFQNERGQSNEAQAIWQQFEKCFREIDQILNQLAAEEQRAAQVQEQAKQPNLSQQHRDQLLQRVNFDRKPYRERLKSTFSQHYQTNGLIPSASPRAKFVATLAKERDPRTAIFACGYLMGTHLDYGTPDRLEGALAASYFEQGFISRAPSETESLSELRRNWEEQFQKIQDDISAQAKAQSDLNAETGAQLLKQQSEFTEQLTKEKSEWATLHKIYDEQLALEKPVAYWRDKAKTHRTFSWVFGALSVGVGIAVFLVLYEFVQITLRPPEGLKDPALWHPEYWRIGVLLSAGVFGVWVVRIVVRLFLSHVHLLADANERVTMANTYLALQHSKEGLHEKDRQLILQVLFRPSASGVVKDDGVPLSWIEAITKTGH
jgi:hypothetical protein